MGSPDVRIAGVDGPEGTSKGRNSRPLHVLLVGNYPLDRQESMKRFADMMSEGLASAGIQVELLCPSAVFGRLGKSTVSGIGKWLGYIDKFLIFPLRLRSRSRELARTSGTLGEGKDGPAVVVHICDHSNAMYSGWTGGLPVVATCHDLLAVRGAMGEPTDCPATWAGKILQEWIVKGLSRASMIASDSTATMQDVARIVKVPADGVQSRLVLVGLNYRYRKLGDGEADARMKGMPIEGRQFVLHVGSNLRRKNREGVMRMFARTADRWDGLLVFAGQALSPELRAMADDLQIRERVIEVAKPDSDLLEALYNKATALLFPSRFEGFGWPIIEAQACGCPVICSNTGPMPEVAGDAAMTFALEDEDGFAAAILRLTDPAERAELTRRGFVNIQRFSTARMINDYISIYEHVLGGK